MARELSEEDRKIVAMLQHTPMSKGELAAEFKHCFSYIADKITQLAREGYIYKYEIRNRHAYWKAFEGAQPNTPSTRLKDTLTPLMLLWGGFPLV